LFSGSRGSFTEPPEEVIVFFVGGTTYEEELCVSNFNAELRKSGSTSKVILGGTHFHNSKSFLEEVSREFPEDEAMKAGDLPDKPVSTARSDGAMGAGVRSRFGGRPPL